MINNPNLFEEIFLLEEDNSAFYFGQKNKKKSKTWIWNITNKYRGKI